MNPVAQLLRVWDVYLDVDAADKAALLERAATLLAQRSAAPVGDVLQSLLQREQLGSTGLGHGVAIPHARTPSLSALTLVAGLTAQPIDYGALDGMPVRLFFLLAGPETMAASQVRALARIARVVRREYVRDRLLEAGTSEAFCQVVRDAEGQ